MADQNLEKHTIIAWVEDKPGVLYRIAGLFSRRNFNIESLSVAQTEKSGVSRMTFVTIGTQRDMQQIYTQLNKQINVLRIEDVTNYPSVDRELALIKVQAGGHNRHEVVQIAQLHRADVVDVTIDSLVVQILARPDLVQSLIDNLTHFDIIEMVRTGNVSMKRSHRRRADD